MKEKTKNKKQHQDPKSPNQKKNWGEETQLSMALPALCPQLEQMCLTASGCTCLRMLLKI